MHLILKAERYLRGESDTLELYRLAKSDEQWRALRDSGTCPWWLPDTGRLDFLRPVTTLSFFIDVRLFGRNPLGYRLMSLGVFAIALVCVHWLFRQATDDPVRPGVAALFFGIAQTVAPPVTWPANRQDLFVVIGTSLAAGAYWASIRRPGFKWIVLAAVAFAFALFSKEVAVALAGIVALHEVFRRRAASARWSRPVPMIIAALFVAMTLAFLSYYVSSRPWVLELAGRDGLPTQLGTRLPLSLLLYAAVWCLGFPIDILFGASSAQSWTVATAAGLLLLITLRYMRRSIRGDRAALFFALWAILFILPGLRALTASSRTLCTATVGWAYLLVGLIVPCREEDVVVPQFLRHLLFATNGTVSIGCVIGTVLVMNHAETAARTHLTETVSRLDTPLKRDDTLIIAQAPSALDITCGRDRLEFLTGKRDVSLIYMLPPSIDADVRPVDDHTLLVESRRGGLFQAPLHRLTLGPNWTPAVGRTFVRPAFTARITDLSAEGAVRTMTFRFRESLDSPRLHFDPDLSDAPHRRAAVP